MTTPASRALAAEQQADALRALPHPAADQTSPAQDLASGSAGIALAHIERARSGLEDWRAAHARIVEVVAAPLSDHDGAGLFFGAPALSFVLDAAAGTSDRYRSGLSDLDEPVSKLAHRRAKAALARIGSGKPTTFAEYDVFSGLAGLGALLLRRDAGGGALERVLTYMVALTRPLQAGDRMLPGWWVSHDPHRKTPPGYGGHANLGAAHGISGPLALLAQAVGRGVTVDGHHQAIADICHWLITSRQEGPTGWWWPEHLRADDLGTGKSRLNGPARPSWCYGTPGIARAGQLAAIALNDPALQRDFETALLGCATDEAQLAQLTDAGLCHGWAGTFQTLWRAASDAADPALARQLPHLADALMDEATRPHQRGPGLLNGTAGTALALLTAATETAPTSGWDACLLID